MATKKEKREAGKKKYNYVSTEQVLERSDAGFKPTSFSVPKDWELLRLDKAGQLEIDLMPHVAGEHNPLADKGMVVWDSRHEIHDGIGVDTKKKYVCPARRGMGRCPICEHAARLRMKGADKETLKPFRPKTRVLYAVKAGWEGTEKKNYLFEQSFFGKPGFGELIQNKLEAVAHKPKHPYHRFWHPDGGRTLACTVKKDTFPGGIYYKISNIEMIEREEQYDEDVIEETPNLEELINKMVLPYDKLKAIFEQEPEGEEASTKKKKKPKDEEEEEDDESAESEDDEEEDGEEDLEETDEDDEETDGSDDDESDDDDNDSGDDSEDAEEEEEGSEEEDEEEGDEGETYEKGDSVTFKYKKKVKTGTVKKVVKRKGKCDLLKIEVEDQEALSLVDADDPTLSKVEDEDGDEDENEEEEEGGEEAEDEGDEEADDSEDDGEGDSEDSEDEDGEGDADDVEEEDDDDVPFSDEEEEEEEEPKPVKKKKKK